ncbi:hypothetical protein ACA910_016640 [Epithemia clementina (nom. ined.)]
MLLASSCAFVPRHTGARCNRPSIKTLEQFLSCGLWKIAPPLLTASSSSKATEETPPENVEETVQPINDLESLTRTDGSSSSEKSNSSKRRTSQKIVFPPPQPASEFPDWAFEPRSFFSYELIHRSSKSQARVGKIHTPHGTIDTPGFVAVATNGALKGVDFRDADASGQQLVFANTYHLLLHPGPDIIEEAGGIHKYTRRNRPFITDSGGFQVFSLAYGSIREELESKGELKRATTRVKDGYRTDVVGHDAVKITEDGVVFRSYRDGTKFLLTPESTVQAQKKIGADIIIPLDELPGYYVDRDKLHESLERTHRWEARSLQEHLKDVRQQAMYCVVHGGVDPEFRRKSVDYLTSLPFDGFGIGGSLGNGRKELRELLSWLMPMFETGDRSRKPRHLLGIADEESIRHAVTLGIDTFDSCYPTRLGRHGTVMSRQGTIKLKSSSHARSFGVKIDSECNCPTCQIYDRAYLWHLFKANEPIAVTLAATHNIHYMNDLTKSIRDDIMNDRL